MQLLSRRSQWVSLMTSYRKLGVNLIKDQKQMFIMWERKTRRLPIDCHVQCRSPGSGGCFDVFWWANKKSSSKEKTICGPKNVFLPHKKLIVSSHQFFYLFNASTGTLSVTCIVVFSPRWWGIPQAHAVKVPWRKDFFFYLSPHQKKVIFLSKW